MTRSVAPDSLPGSYVFGRFRLSDDGTLLVADGAAVAVAPKVLQTLLVLVQRAGQVVTKDDLIRAVWPDTCVEDTGLTRNISVLRQTLGEDGQRFIATVPRIGYRFLGVVEHLEGGPSEEVAPTWNSPPTVQPSKSLAERLKPSIAVLPFQNMSGDPEQDYFADGMVEDIITGLSRIKWLFVIARNSTFVYKGRAIGVKDVGRELGVRYVLEGSVRKVGPRVRINAQLIDAKNATHLWTERYDRALDDVFALQDEIASSVAGAIAPELEAAEIGRARAKPTENLDAYDSYLLGWSRVQAVFANRREAINEALSLFNRSIQLDPEYAAAYAMAAFCLVLRRDFGWGTGDTAETAELERLAREGARLAGQDAVALYASGHALTRIPGQLDAGTGLIERALQLDPNLAAAWHLGGWARLLRGEADLAIEHFEQAMRLSPRDPLLFAMQQGMAAAHFLAARYDDAATWAEKSLQVQPNYAQALRMAAASHASAGRPTEAAAFIARVRELDPELRLANLARAVPFRGAEDIARYTRALCQAGLPE
jgi:TolB-like protein